MKIGQANIAMIGGGTGLSANSASLSKHCKNVTAIACMSDNGGSTGVLRSDYGVLPPGDLRKVMSSLASDRYLADIMEYRFSSGSLSGHTVGNVVIAAMQLIGQKDIDEGLDHLQRVMELRGRVLPVSDQLYDLVYTTPEGEEVKGEIDISYRDFSSDEHPNMHITPQVKATSSVIEAIENADLVLIAPGLLYGSLAPTLLCTGISQAIKTSKAPLACVGNLTRQKGMKNQVYISDYVSELERFAKNKIDFAFTNTNIPIDQGDYLRPDESSTSFEMIKGDYLRKEEVKVENVTRVTRSKIKHNVDAVSQSIVEFVESSL